MVLLCVCGLRVGGWALLGTQLAVGFPPSGLPLGGLLPGGSPPGELLVYGGRPGLLCAVSLGLTPSVAG